MTLSPTSSAPTAAATLVSPAGSERGRALVSTARPIARRPALPTAWLAAGLLALTGVAGAAYWAGRTATPGAAPVESAAGFAKPLAANALPAPVYSPTTPSVQAPAMAGPAGPAPGTGGHGVATAGATAAPVCAHCGVVESVQAVQHKGQASGAGAVAGGVLGGVLGHQMGGGKGRTAMTVLGAVGGGLAGNEVEKRSKSTTSYRVKVRTDSGALRTVEQATAPAVGQRVRLDGSSLHAINP